MAKKKYKADNYMGSGLSKGAYLKKRKTSRTATIPIYKSGFKNGKRIDFGSSKTKRGIITSLD